MELQHSIIRKSGNGSFKTLCLIKQESGGERDPASLREASQECLGSAPMGADWNQLWYKVGVGTESFPALQADGEHFKRSEFSAWYNCLFNYRCWPLSDPEGWSVEGTSGYPF